MPSTVQWHCLWSTHSNHNFLLAQWPWHLITKTADYITLHESNCLCLPTFRPGTGGPSTMWGWTWRGYPHIRPCMQKCGITGILSHLNKDFCDVAWNVICVHCVIVMWAKSCDDHMDPSDTHTHRGSTSVLADWSTCVCLGVVEGHINACNIRVLMRSLSMSYC